MWTKPSDEIYRAPRLLRLEAIALIFSISISNSISISIRIRISISVSILPPLASNQF